MKDHICVYCNDFVSADGNFAKINNAYLHIHCYKEIIRRTIRGSMTAADWSQFIWDDIVSEWEE